MKDCLCIQALESVIGRFHMQVSKKQLYELYRKRWSQMADNKKMKYIKKALEAKEKYDVSTVFTNWRKVGMCGTMFPNTTTRRS